MNLFIVRPDLPAKKCREGRHGRRRHRPAALGYLFILAVSLHSREVTSAAILRVDDSSLTVPAILNDEWRAVKAHREWSLAEGKVISGEPRFSRFLARDYQFTLDEDAKAMSLRTTWFAGGKCVSTTEAVSGLSNARRTALEAAFGSLNDIYRALQGQSADGSTGHVVIWASFKAKPDMSVPVETLATDDQARLAPFIDLARQTFEARLFNDADCTNSNDLNKARDSIRSGGRRMPTSRSSQSRVSSSRGTPRPEGRMVAGTLPQRIRTSSGNQGRQSDDSDSDSQKGNKQRWGFVISKYVAEPGSLVFSLAGQFTRCVRADSEAAALASMKATYRPVISVGGGKRVSFTVAPAESSVCEDSDGDSLQTQYVPGNFETPPGDDLPDGEGELMSDGDGGEAMTPFADPLDVDSAAGESMTSGNLEDVDLLSIPVLDEIDDAGTALESPAVELSDESQP